MQPKTYISGRKMLTDIGASIDIWRHIWRHRLMSTNTGMYIDYIEATLSPRPNPLYTKPSYTGLVGHLSLILPT